MGVNDIKREDQIDKQRILSRLPLFEGLGDDATAAMAAVSRVAFHPAGDEIIEEGTQIHDDEDGLYILISGTVEVRKHTAEDATEHVLASFGPGEFFGEMALLDGFPRSASVFATSDSLCLMLSRWDFLQVIRRNPEIAIKMLATMSRRLRKTSQETVMSALAMRSSFL
jgi:CRP/FNR family transcriptional regulator, cyclic AMP receptor protein